jgi:RNA polymerase sigma factor (sigma-70 family)
MQIKTDSEQELIKSYLRGNEQALEILVNTHKDRVYSYIYHLVRDHQLAEDVFQDTFFKVINTLKKDAYNDEGKFLPWVMRIAHNLVIDNFRRLKRMPEVDGGDDFEIFDIIGDDSMNVEQQIVDEQINNDVVKLIEFLPDEQKEVLKLRIFSGMSFKEIAQDTNVSINTALGRMRYALINLRKMIEEKWLVLTIN